MGFLKWGRSKGGYCDSKCGRFEIRPIYAGGARPIWFQLVHDGKATAHATDTQAEAKTLASRIEISETFKTEINGRACVVTIPENENE